MTLVNRTILEIGKCNIVRCIETTIAMCDLRCVFGSSALCQPIVIVNFHDVEQGQFWCVPLDGVFAGDESTNE